MKISTSARRSVLGFAAALAISSALVMPTLADNSVTQQITGGGNLSAFISNATMNSIAYSNTAGSTTGNLTLHVNDPRGTSDGWNVTTASSAFVYGGGSALGQNIPSSGFLVGTPGTPSMTAGQAVDATGGPNAGSGGSLNAARETISAEIGFGSGTYDQNLPVSLAIPAYSQTGTYVATLTVSITSAP